MDYKKLEIQKIVGTKFEGELETVRTYGMVSKNKLLEGGDLLTFYTEDWRFSKIIRSSREFYSISKNFKYVCMPDYSVYYDEPLVDQLYKISVAYRICKRMERMGIRIIRNIFLTDERIFDINSYGNYSGDYCVQLRTKTDEARAKTDIRLINTLPNKKLVYCEEVRYNRLCKLGLLNTIRIPAEFKLLTK